MSNDAGSRHPNNGSERSGRQQSLVAQVNITALSDGSSERSRPATSRSDSLRQEKDKWMARGGYLKDKFLTPPHSLSSRKSTDTLMESDSVGSGRDRASLPGPSSGLLSTKASGKQRAGSIPRALKGTDSVTSKSRSVSLQTSSRDHAESPAGLTLLGRGQRMAKSPSMDPAQLVQMALNLSESRKRHASNPSTSIASVALAGRDRTSLESPSPAGLLDDIRASRYVSPVSSTTDPRISMEDTATGSSNGSYHFSPATLARAEKARQYFELADKHRRLLQHLPRNSTDEKTGRTRAHSRASSIPFQDRGPTQLGRPYNPLQALRNRRSRQQGDSPTLPVEAFADVDHVEQWLSQVENGADESLKRSSSGHLPVYTFAEPTLNGTTKGHNRSSTADTIITRPQHQWSITPAELLADLYWTEQGQNGSVVDPKGTSGRARSSTVNSHSSRYPPTLPLDDDTPDKVRHNHLHLLPLNAANRLRQHRFTRRNRSASASSASSTEGRKKSPSDINIGPLQRHMDELIRRDADEESFSPPTQSPDHWDTVKHHRKSIIEHYKKPPRPSQGHNGQVLSPLTEMNGHFGSPGPMSSPDSSYPASPIVSSAPLSSTAETSSPIQLARELSSPRSKLSLRNSKATDLSNISEADHEPTAPDAVVDPTRLSVEAARPSTFRRHKTTDSISNSLREFVQARSRTDGFDRDSSSAVGRLLRGGRDMVRNESTKLGNKIRGRDRRGEASDVSAANTDVSDAEDMGRELSKGNYSAEQSDTSARGSFEKTRSRRYNVPQLPSFRSPRAQEPSNDGIDHITRQQANTRQRNRSPRFERLAPPRILLPDDTQDSSYLSVDAGHSAPLDERRQSYGFLNPALRRRSQSHSKTRSSLGRGRLSQQPSATMLSPVSAKAADHNRQWSISDTRPPGIFSAKEHGVTSRDVARVRALLLASGIKAREISRRLTAPSDAHPAFLLEAAHLVDTPETALQKRPQHEETVYAVEILSTFVDNVLGKLSRDIETFQSGDLQMLITRLEKLKMRVSEELTELVHGASDQADGFNIELSTQATLRTKEVDDMIDMVLRLRRRQFRLLRLAAFKMLELVTLSLLWTVWFVVVCFKTVQRIILGIIGFLRWLIIF